MTAIRQSNRWAYRALAAAAILALAACAAMTPRLALPVAASKSASVDGFADIRFRGDVLTKAVQAVVESQYRQILATQPAGGRDERTRSVDFLAISGGGADGAFAAGFLNGWSQSGTRPKFEVVTGVSTGALVAPFAFLGVPYDPALRKIYTGISDADVYVSKGPIGVLGESLLDPAPLRALIEDRLTDDFLDKLAAEYGRGRRLLVQTTDVERQFAYIWDLTKIATGNGPERRKLIVDVLLASAAIPGVFPPIRINVTIDGVPIEELHVDGGLTAQVFFAPPDLNLAKFETRFFGQPRQHRLYLIRNGKIVAETEPTEPSTLALAKRAIATLIKYQSLQDIGRIQAAFNRNGSRLHSAAIPPTFRVPAVSLFDQNYMKALYAEGYRIGAGGNRWAEGGR